MKASQKQIIFSSIDEHPLVAPLVAKRIELQAQCKLLSDEKRVIDQRLRDSAQGIDPLPSPVTRRANELVFGKADAPAFGGEARAVELACSIRDLHAAIEVATAAIEKARGLASREVCDQHRDTARQLQSALSSTLVGAVHAAAALHEFQSAMQDAGIQTGSLQIDMPNFLNPVSPHEPVAAFLRDAVKRGVLPAKDLPERYDFSK